MKPCSRNPNRARNPNPNLKLRTSNRLTAFASIAPECQIL